MLGPRTISGSYSRHRQELLCKPKAFVEHELHLQVLGQEPRLGDPVSYTVTVIKVTHLTTLCSKLFCGSVQASLEVAWKILKFRFRQTGVGTEPKKRENPPRPLLLETLSHKPRRRAPPEAGHFLFESSEKSGNLGHQPETRKGIKMAGCLRKQRVGRINKHTNSWFVGHERCAVARYAAPPRIWVCQGAISTCYLQPPRSRTP